MERVLFTIQELKDILKREPVYSPDNPYNVYSVVIDSRNAESSSLFIPLKGEHTDGHRFLVDAAIKGARTLIVAEDFRITQKNEILKDLQKREVFIIAVPDPLKALQDLAKQYLERFSSLYRIGITGSNGK